MTSNGKLLTQIMNNLNKPGKVGKPKNQAIQPIVDPRGQWAHPGKHTIVPTANGRITMKGVSYPVYGQDETGFGQMMMPGSEYSFPGQMVYEVPIKSKDMFNYEMAYGGQMIRRADGSYSKRGLWDNIRANRGSGKKPTKEMLEQERKIRAQEKAMYGMEVYQKGAEIDSKTVLSEIDAALNKLMKLRQFVQPETNKMKKGGSTWSGNAWYQSGGDIPSIDEMDKFDENAYKQMMQAAITSAQGQMQQNTDNLSFGKAFALHRSLGDKTFEWKGKKYTTELATETKPKKPQTARQPAVGPKYNLTTPEWKDRYDKYKVYKTKDGYVAIRNPDGQVEVYLPDRKDVYYPDGTIEKRYKNNRVVNINPKGEMTIGDAGKPESYVPLKSPTKSSRSSTQVKSPTAAVKKQNSQRVNGPLTAITEGIDWLNDHTGDNPLGAATRFVLNTVKAPFEGGKNLAANTQTLVNEGRNEFGAHSALDAVNAFAPALGKGMAFVSENVFPFLAQAPGVVFSGGTSVANRAVLSATPKAAGAAFPASSRNMLDETLTAFSKMASSDSKHAAKFADARNSLWNSRIPFQAGGPIVGQELEVTPEQVEILRAQGYEFEII